MYVSLNKPFLVKTEKKAIEESIAQFGDEGKNSLLYEGIKEDSMEIEVEDDEIVMDIHNDLGYFNISIPLNTDTLEQIISVVIRRMNKMKSLLESLK
jgi:hypothetical protein